MHPYLPTIPDNGKCNACNRPLSDHNSETARCDKCKSLGASHMLHEVLYCDICFALTQNNQVKESASTIKMRRAEDTILTRADFFNAKVTSIVDMRKSIDEDSEIKNKDFEEAKQLREHFTHLQTVLFNLKLEESKAISEQRAIQTRLNHLSNQITKEEREKLQLNNLSYNPAPPKEIKAPRVNKPKQPKMAEVKKYAAMLGISEYTLKGFIVLKGCSVEEAANMIKASRDTSLEESVTVRIIGLTGDEIN